MKEQLLDYLIRVNTDKDSVITAFEDKGEIVIWQEFPFKVLDVVHLMDRNPDENEKTGKVWRLYRFSLNGFQADRITWQEKPRTYYKNVKESYPYKAPVISWESGILNLEEVSGLLNNSVFKQLEPGQFDRYFRKYIFGLVMQQPGQEQLNVKSYFSNFLNI